MTKKIILAHVEVEVLNKCDDEYDIIPADFDVFYLSIQDQKLRLEAEGWTQLKITIHKFEDPKSWQGLERLAFQGMRIESDEEYQERLSMEKYRKEEQEKDELRERNLFLRLKKKYEG